MAIRFVEKPDERPRKPANGPAKGAETKGPPPRDSGPPPAQTDRADSDQPWQQPSESKSDARTTGEARFATAIEAPAPVNPDASGELPFVDLPRAEKAARKKRTPKPKAPPGAEEPSLT